MVVALLLLEARHVIIIKSPGEIEVMKEAGRISAKALRVACEAAAPGVTTAEIDAIAEETIRKEGAVPSFLGYAGFPGSICASVNEQVVHGIPSPKKVLKEGDILTVDVGAIFDGYHGDNANTVGVGTIDPDSQRLIDVTRRALYAGIEAARIGNHLCDVSAAIGAVADEAGLGIVREYVGHGIGRDMHEDPNVPNYYDESLGQGPLLRKGMVIAIEPMLNLGGDAVRTLRDGWTVITRDKKRSAQIEHTIALTAEGPIILTQE